MNNQRHIFTMKEREIIWSADKIPLTGYLPWVDNHGYGYCRYCGIKSFIHPVQWNDWHVAHEIPVSRWPRIFPLHWRDSFFNTGVAHPECNLAAGSQPMTVWQSVSLRWKIRLVIFLSIITLFLAMIVSNAI